MRVGGVFIKVEVACRSGPGEWSNILGVVRSACQPSGCLCPSYSSSEECPEVLSDSEECPEVLSGSEECPEVLSGSEECPEVLSGSEECPEVLRMVLSIVSLLHIGSLFNSWFNGYNGSGTFIRCSPWSQ